VCQMGHDTLDNLAALERFRSQWPVLTLGGLIWIFSLFPHFICNLEAQ
jgi:hypothetical protein